MADGGVQGLDDECDPGRFGGRRDRREDINDCPMLCLPAKSLLTGAGGHDERSPPSRAAVSIDSLIVMAVSGVTPGSVSTPPTMHPTMPPARSVLRRQANIC